MAHSPANNGWINDNSQSLHRLPDGRENTITMQAFGRSACLACDATLFQNNYLFRVAGPTPARSVII